MHSVLAVLHVVAVLLFLHTLRIGMDYDGEMEVRVLESVVAVLIGVPTFLSWRHAMQMPGMLGELSRGELDLALAHDLRARLTSQILWTPRTLTSSLCTQAIGTTV